MSELDKQLSIGALSLREQPKMLTNVFTSLQNTFLTLPPPPPPLNKCIHQQFFKAKNYHEYDEN